MTRCPQPSYQRSFAKPARRILLGCLLLWPTQPGWAADRSIGQPAHGLPVKPVVGAAATTDTPRAPLLTSEVSLGWWPGHVGEGYAAGDGTAYRLGGPWPTGARMAGRARLGPFLLLGAYGTSVYSLWRDDTRQAFGRWQQQGELEAVYCVHWTSNLSIAAGPSLLLDRTDVLDLPALQGRTLDYLDMPLLRFSGGVTAMGAFALPTPWPMTLDARVAVHPLAWLQTAAPFDASGLWSLQGSAGIRWYPWGRFGLDARYRYHGWQTPAYHQGQHGLQLGGVYTF